jgi:acyl-CoA reductase-like NAD-dependent aldehyde dehydrogenase
MSAIRAGNSVVIKPSPFTPLSTLRMVELIKKILPAGLVNIVSGGDKIGADLVAH